MKSQNINLKYTLNSAQTFLVVGCSDARVNLFIMEVKKTNYQNAIPLNEDWKRIDKNYFIHPKGYVRSSKKNKLLTGGKTKGGYYTVALNGKSFTIHRLVAIAFIPNPENKKCVNHIDGNKLNNHISNLEWMTHSENELHAYKTGLKKPRK